VAAPRAVPVVVDVANVMGSRPDGWWRDRIGAAGRLLAELTALVGCRVPGPDGRLLTVTRVIAVIEGQARAATDPGFPGLLVVRAPADGDSTIVAEAGGLVAAGERPVVVTADRGLRARIPGECAAVGPRWVRDALACCG
jgi:hypothetical protein